MTISMRVLLAASLFVLTLDAQEGRQSGAGAAGSTNKLAEGMYRIAGEVVNANSGEPLDRVDVTISSTAPGGPQAAASTAEDGHFSFEGLKAGKYRVVAARRGYATSAYQEHQGFFTAIVAGPGLDTAHLRFPIMPTAILSGTVIDDAGDPVAGAEVTLFRQNPADGQSNAMRTQSIATNDSGAFEFNRLEAGTYFVSAVARPWYAFHPQQRSRQPDGRKTEEEPPRSPLDVAYPTTFYADATDSAAASPITLRAGDHPQIALTMHAVPAVQLRVKVPWPAADSNRKEPRITPYPVLSQNAFGTSEIIRSITGSVVESDGQRVFEMSGLAPGEYTLEFPGSGAQLQGAPVQINLSGDQVFDRSSVAPGTEVNGTLAMAFGAAAPEGLAVTLAPVNGRVRGAGQQVAQDGAFTFHDVAPGFYELVVTGGGRQLPVLSIRAAGKEIEGGRIQIGSDAVTLGLTAAVGSATMSGFVQRHGQGIGGAMVVLAPHHPGSNPYLFRRDQSDSDGSFTLSGIVPGRYTLIAIDDGWELEWARDGALQKYLVQGIEMQVKAGVDKVVLSEPLEAQDR